jgi:hypothetical protein
MVSLEGEKKKISGIRTIKDGDSYWVGGGGGDCSHEGGGRIPRVGIKIAFPFYGKR